MFQLSREEFNNLKSQIVTSSWGGLRRATPYAFTEQGVAMLSSVLNSPRAIQVNVEIMRAFVRLRRMLASHEDLARKLYELEKRYDAQFRAVFDAIRQLMAPPEKARRSPGARMKGSRCPCRISLSPRWVPARGRGAGLPGAAGAALVRVVMGGLTGRGGGPGAKKRKLTWATT